MRNLLFLLFLSSNVFALADQQMIDQWVNLALQSPEQKLIGNGKINCGFDILYEEQYDAKASSPDLAVAQAQLRCMKDQCSKIGARMSESINELRGLDSEDLDAYLESLFYETHQRSEIDDDIHSSGASSLSSINCTNGTPSVRMGVYSMCTSLPMKCTKTKKK